MEIPVLFLDVVVGAIVAVCIGSGVYDSVC